MAANRKGVLGCLAIALFMVLLIAFIASIEDKRTRTNGDKDTVSLNASVRFTGTQFIIANNDPFDWTNVTMRVNSGAFGTGGYALTVGRVAAGATYTVGALQFAKSDGTRFDPWAVKPQNFTIASDTPNGRGYLVAEFR